MEKERKTTIKNCQAEAAYDPLKLENQLCFPLYAAAREVVQKYRPYLDELNLTYTQYITMMVLWEYGEISAKELGKKLFLDSGTLTPVLKSLEKKGFVSRSRSAEDERVLLVSVTDTGIRLREQAVKVPEKIAGCICLKTEEAVQLYTLLYKVLGNC
ncbi:MAG: MarR family transcriptional regulator [Eubacterium sp.]|nr:MarR family transcriptional regulator [Eubacterium sp.]